MLVAGAGRDASYVVEQVAKRAHARDGATMAPAPVAR
jgi:hypothetical protein